MATFGKLKSRVRPPFSIASAATLKIPGHLNKFKLTGSTTITSIPQPSTRDIGRKIELIGGASASVLLTNTDDPTTAGQMDLGGADVTLGEDDRIELELQSDGTWLATGPKYTNWSAQYVG